LVLTYWFLGFLFDNRNNFNQFIKKEFIKKKKKKKNKNRKKKKIEKERRKCLYSLGWSNSRNFNYWVAFKINLIDVAKISCSCSFNNL